MRFVFRKVMWRLSTVCVLAFATLMWTADQVKAESIGQEIFQSQCAACHTIGKGKLVGPDLSGVTTRREESWLRRQIKEPDQLIEEKDPIAMQLLKESDNVPMAPLDLNDEQVIAVIEYLKSIEKQAVVTVGIPDEYIPTIIVSVVVLILLTFLGLKVGNKRLDVS